MNFGFTLFCLSDLVRCFRSFVVPSTDSTPLFTLLSLVLQSLQKNSTIVESQSQRMLPLFLTFLGYSTGHVDRWFINGLIPHILFVQVQCLLQSCSFLIYYILLHVLWNYSVDSFKQYACKSKEWKCVLKEWLNLLRKTRNLKSFHKSDFLKEVLEQRSLS